MFNAADYMISDLTLQTIRAESARAIQKHGREDTALNPEMSRGDKLAILMEEVGEVAEVICDFKLGILSPEEAHGKIMKELAQVSSVAAMWLEAEDKNGPINPYCPE